MRFRFVDRVVSFEGGEVPTLVTAKSFPQSEDFTRGHPQRPGEVPTCLVLETLATSAVRLVYSHTEGKAAGVLVRVEEARILCPVVPEEVVTVCTQLLGFQPESQKSVGLARTYGRASVRDREVADARLVLLCFPKDGFEGSLPW